MSHVVKISLTNIGKALFVGRRASEGKVGIIGFKGFADKFALMAKAATDGCPFASGSMPSIKKEIKDIRESLATETRALESQPLLLSVSGESPRPNHFEVSLYKHDQLVLLLHAVTKYDEYVCVCLRSRAGGRISHKECWRRIDKQKKRIRKLFYFCYLYEDYNFRGLVTNRNSDEWHYMVHRFGEPLTTGVERV